VLRLFEFVGLDGDRCPPDHAGAIVTGKHAAAIPTSIVANVTEQLVTEPVRSQHCAYFCHSSKLKVVGTVNQVIATLTALDVAKAVERWQWQPRQMPIDGLVFVHRWF
jgi:hypothetical protein